MTEQVPPQSSSHQWALQWAELPSEHLKIALEALEPELAREHQLKVLQAQLQMQEAKDRRSHQLYLIGLISGFSIAIAMLAGAVAVGLSGHSWLAAMLAGPSVLSLAGLFVLRRIDVGISRQASLSHQAALNSAAQSVPGSSGTA
ncbi:hypothetical protein [Glycomyces sp. NPDC021274]|uniref:hypothetical protein n=1 Tax=Glycomyces sp. NPDC021274 TaxID=3155120 RepID=UPI0033FF5A1F